MARVRVGSSTVSGCGVFAEEDIRAGQTIVTLSGAPVTEEEVDAMLDDGRLRTVDDIFQIAPERYLVLDTLPLAINHSCDPNAGVRGKNTLVAIRDIQKEEEIFYDYSTTVGADNDGWMMSCRCGALICRKTIGSIRSLPPERIAIYRTHLVLPDFIQAEPPIDS